MKTTRNAAAVLAGLIAFTGACQSDVAGNLDTPAPQAHSGSVDELFEILDYRPVRETTYFLGDKIWTANNTGRMFRSRDRGDTWEPVPLPVTEPVTFMQFADDGRRAILVTERGTMLRTADAGATWDTVDLVERVRDKVNPDWRGGFDEMSFDNNLQHGVWVDFCQIFRTEDGGSNWTSHADGLGDEGIVERCVYDVVEEDGVMLAAVEIIGRMLTSGAYLFRSDDNGATWNELCWMDEAGLLLKNAAVCHRMDDLPKAWLKLLDEYDYAPHAALEKFSDGASEGIFVRKTYPLKEALLNYPEHTALVRDETTGRVWFDGHSWLAYTDDMGENWHVVQTAMPEKSIDFSLGLDSGFAVDYEGRLVRSEDGGKHWRVEDIGEVHVAGLAVVSEQRRVVVATSSGIMTAVAPEWNWQSVPGTEDYQSYLVRSGDVIWSFAEEGAVYRSENGGVSWSKLDINLYEEGFYMDDAVCGPDACVLFGAGDYDAVGRLRANPATFGVTELTAEIPVLEEEYSIGVVLDPDLERGWLVTERGRIFATGDAGRSWNKVGRFRGEWSEFFRGTSEGSLIVLGDGGRYLWSKDGTKFEKREIGLEGEGYIESLCWLDDSTVLMHASDDETYGKYFASADGGRTWARSTWAAAGEQCRISPDLVLLDGALVRMK